MMNFFLGEKEVKESSQDQSGLALRTIRTAASELLQGLYLAAQRKVKIQRKILLRGKRYGITLGFMGTCIGHVHQRGLGGVVKGYCGRVVDGTIHTFTYS